jgi:opacity protein-like surface antigen
VISFYPEFVSIVDIPLSANDVDEIAIKLTLKKKGENAGTEYTIGRYDVAGGISASYGAALYVTNLKNNDVYTDSVQTVSAMDTTNQYHAFLANDNKMSIGIGANVDFEFRTGTMFRPVICMGFFVPFEEELTPFVAPGLGFALVTSKAKFTLTGGPAFAKVNAIADRYLGKDLSGLDLSNESLTVKTWQTGWQISVGFSFNLSE